MHSMVLFTQQVYLFFIKYITEYNYLHFLEGSWPIQYSGDKHVYLVLHVNVF